MRTEWRFGLAGLATMLIGTATARAQAPQPIPDPAGLMRSISTEPFRYGGDLEGGLLGLPEIGARPVHLAMGIGAPDANGQVAGRAILFDGERHLIGEGTVDGIVRPQEGEADAPCGLRLHLNGVALPEGAPAASVRPAGDVLLAGHCTRDTLAGELRAVPPRPALIRRLINGWGDHDGTGRYWLTAASFDPPPPPMVSPTL